MKVESRRPITIAQPTVSPFGWPKFVESLNRTPTKRRRNAKINVESNAPKQEHHGTPLKALRLQAESQRRWSKAKTCDYKSCGCSHAKEPFDLTQKIDYWTKPCNWSCWPRLETGSRGCQWCSTKNCIRIKMKNMNIIHAKNTQNNCFILWSIFTAWFWDPKLFFVNSIIKISHHQWPCGFGLVVGIRSIMLGECYSDTSPSSKEVTGSIICICKEFQEERFNLNPSPARSG